MRNIKFRIYFKDEEEFMTKPITIEDLLHEDWIDFENEKGTLSLPLKDFRFFYGKNENYEIMQYTGLKDKNGKEIYEGDIVKCKKYIGGNFIEYCIEKGFVEFKNGEFGLHRKQGYYQSLNKFIEYDYELEIIGNTYDNKNLLEEGE